MLGSVAFGFAVGVADRGIMIRVRIGDVQAPATAANGLAAAAAATSTLTT